MACRGGQLDGPNLDKLFRNLDSLEAFVDKKFHKFVDCLRALDLVSKSCFCKSETLIDGWEMDIDNFKTAYKRLNVSVTPKVHSIFFEVRLFIKKHGRPLGFVTEQKYETVHQDFDPTWNRYKTSENNPNFGDQSERAVVCYNGYNV
jgi:hypothetical protein